MKYILAISMNILGVGVLAIPYAMRAYGIFLGIFIYIMFGFLA